VRCRYKTLRATGQIQDFSITCENWEKKERGKERRDLDDVVFLQVLGGGVNPERHDNVIRRQRRLGEDGRPTSMGDGGDRRQWDWSLGLGEGGARVSYIGGFLAEGHGEGVEAQCGGEGTVQRG
jgi:hypothetical protein